MCCFLVVMGYYDDYDHSFVLETCSVDMSAFRNKFLAAFPTSHETPARLLDAGCGSGRDALAFRLAGFEVKAFDASPKMVAYAAGHAGVLVRNMWFEHFAWDHQFEGIWACASLLHVAEADLPDAFLRLSRHLVPCGVLYASFKLGPSEREKDGRRFTDMTEDRLAALLEMCAGFDPCSLWRSQDRRPERTTEIWLNALAWTA